MTLLLASHFHDEIVRHAATSGLALLAGTLALVAVLALLRWTALHMAREENGASGSTPTAEERRP